MIKHRPPAACPDCDGFTRRDFLRTTLTGLTAAASGVPLLSPPSLNAAPKPTDVSETLVTTLYKSLTPAQLATVCFPFDDPLRRKVDNNWFITDKRVAQCFSPDQQDLIRQIFRGVHSPEYADKVMQQVEHDMGKEGFGGCAVALFGTPGTGKFEFVLTGRHVTRRCDGDSVAGAAFGGPIFYGHAAHGFYEKPDHPGNIYWFQALQANAVFNALDGKQRALALLGNGPAERGTETVRLTGQTATLPGLPVAAMSRDQKDLLRKVMADLLAPFRRPDADEALKLIEDNGFDNLHLAFYKNQDVGNDGVWDVWQIEGPAMIWYFRGDPHVHVWVHVREDAQQA